MSDWKSDETRPFDRQGETRPQPGSAPSADAAPTGEQQHDEQHVAPQYGAPQYGGQQYGGQQQYQQPYGSSAPPPYGQDQYPAPPRGYYTSPVPEGDQASSLSLVFGILAILVFPPVFGPLAIWQANRAERLGRPATAGKVLGWIGVAISIFALLVIGAVVFFAILGMSASTW